MRLYNLFILFFTLRVTSGTVHVHRSLPRSPAHFLKRQIGYGPEYGDCTTGLTCKDSCGKDYEECPASTELVLFCYNPVAGQKCCKDGNGKACDRGYYCTQDSKSKTWCCPEALSPEACASSFGFPNPLKTTSASTTSAATSGPTSVSRSSSPSTPTSVETTNFPSTGITTTVDTITSPTPTITTFVNTSTLPNSTVVFFTGGVQSGKFPGISFFVSALMSAYLCSLSDARF